MQWLKTGRQIGLAVKNVPRLRQITKVFAKNGFVDIVERVQLGKFLPTRLAAIARTQTEKSQPQRLRESFEELGPTFVKLGQLLSTRPDIVPEPFIEELVRLQDNVQAIPFDSIRSVIESELGCQIEQAFESISETPLASASMSQVHEAVLKSGEKVVVKVQRPEIRDNIEKDIWLLAFLSRLLEKYVPEVRLFAPTVIVDEFFRTLSFELDFRVESNNMTKMAENLAEFEEIKVPKVYKDLCSEKVLTLEKFDGVRVNDLKAIEEAGIDRKFIVEVGARAFFKSIMIDGLFHGDLHGGNLFVLPGNKIGLIDFGIVGRLSEKARDQLANMLISLLNEDFENLCYQYAELGVADASIDFQGFQRELRNKLSPYLGLSLSEINSGKVLIDATKIATKYRIQIPGDWMLVFKAMFTIEGMGRTLDPDFDFLSMGNDMVKDLVKNQYSPQRIGKDLVWIAKDVSALLQVLPRQIRWMFQKFNKNDFAIETKSPELREIRKQLDINSKRASFSLIAASALISGSLALHYLSESKVGEYPTVAIILFSIALLGLIRIFFI